MGNIKLFGQGRALGIWGRRDLVLFSAEEEYLRLERVSKCLISSRLCLISWFELISSPSDRQEQFGWEAADGVWSNFCLLSDSWFGTIFSLFHRPFLSRLLLFCNLYTSIFPPGTEGGKAASVSFNLLASLVSVCFPKNQKNPLLLLFNVIWEREKKKPGKIAT